MIFRDAIRALFAGAKVARRTWNGTRVLTTGVAINEKGTFIEVVYLVWTRSIDNGLREQYFPSHEDSHSSDWFVVIDS